MTTPFQNRKGIRYGFMGLPLAFVALPLYVILPHHYASQYGVPLATLGLILLLARFFDAAIDPLLGRWSDQQFARSATGVLRWGVLLAAVLGVGFTMLFFPPVRELPQLGWWLAGSLLLTYVAFSAISIMHQSWGARLGGDEAQRSRIVAWREGLGLVGVLLASVLPVAAGLPATTAVFFLALAIACGYWFQAPRPVSAATQQHATISLWLPFRRPAFRALLAVFIVNGIASAIPATLLLFFVQDRLQAPSSMEPVFLGSYFVCAALSIPAWLVAVRRWGLARSWLGGMALSVSVFLFAAGLGAGDSAGFIAVCALSGIGLGADLALPSALLAGVIQTNGDQGSAEGAYFGWWNFSTKLNLALAAGLALPILGALGYAPGSRDPAALQMLTWSYCLLPCVLKLGAATLLYTLIIRRKP
jgi:glycoside/pentoside/hexuronide:cation symporter, GPH family